MIQTTLQPLHPDKAMLPCNEIRNPGTDFNQGWLDSICLNSVRLNQFSQQLTRNRLFNPGSEIRWLLTAVTLTDLTSLSGNDTPHHIERLCYQARNPLPDTLLAGLKLAPESIHTAAVCIYPTLLKTASSCLSNSAVRLVTVATGFPTAQTSMDSRLDELSDCNACGVDEIDIVINRQWPLLQDWQSLYEEIKAFRTACGTTSMKVIIATGDLESPHIIARTALVAMMAGADFVKTSTGKENINATLPVSYIILQMIYDYYRFTGHRVGFKPAGSIHRAASALNFMVLVNEILGPGWLRPELFRLGASSLINDIADQLTRLQQHRV